MKISSDYDGVWDIAVLARELGCTPDDLCCSPRCRVIGDEVHVGASVATVSRALASGEYDGVWNKNELAAALGCAPRAVTRVAEFGSHATLLGTGVVEVLGLGSDVGVRWR